MSGDGKRSVAKWPKLPRRIYETRPSHPARYRAAPFQSAGLRGRRAVGEGPLSNEVTPARAALATCTIQTRMNNTHAVAAIENAVSLRALKLGANGVSGEVFVSARVRHGHLPARGAARPRTLRETLTD